MHNRTSGRLGLLASSYVLAVMAALGATAASAQDTGARAGNGTRSSSAARATPAVAKPYFVDFRSRSALSYGHTFLVYGRLNAQGKIIESHVAGLSPFTESSVPWMIGHLIPVPSETGATDGDTEDQYITASYRVLLSAPEYNKAVAYIKQHQADSKMWHALLHNCNAWVGEVAAYMGLKSPFSSVFMYPADYITNLREVNGGRRYLDPSFAGGTDATAIAATASQSPRTANAASPQRVTGSAPRGAAQRARTAAEAARANAAVSDTPGPKATGTADASPAQSIY